MKSDRHYLDSCVTAKITHRSSLAFISAAAASLVALSTDRVLHITFHINSGRPRNVSMQLSQSISASSLCQSGKVQRRTGGQVKSKFAGTHDPHMRPMLI